MQPQGYFITGTDTGIGKTYITVWLMEGCKRAGMAVSGMKPVASGCDEIEGCLRNEDALRIQSACSVDHSYEVINPYAYRDPVSPHIAAQTSGLNIDINKIVTAYRHLEQHSDIIFVEGVGGWRVPLSESLTIGGMARKLGLPVILVVGLRLGCINHALLTSQVIYADRIPFAGWIANHIDENYLAADKTIETLLQQIPAPLLGIVPYDPAKDARQCQEEINIDLLLKTCN